MNSPFPRFGQIFVQILEIEEACIIEKNDFCAWIFLSENFVKENFYKAIFEVLGYAEEVVDLLLFEGESDGWGVWEEVEESCGGFLEVEQGELGKSEPGYFYLGF